MNLADKIEQRQAGREAAAEVIAWMDDLMESASEQFVDAFWQMLIDAYSNRITKPVIDTPLEPMSDTAARLFGQTHMQFGKYLGDRIDEVPLDYLIWLSDQPDDFKRKLRRYIRSRRIQQERDQNEP